jgi:hypothetical protein
MFHAEETLTEEENDSLLRIAKILALLLLLLYLFTDSYFEHKHIKFIQSSAVCLLLGMGISYMISSIFDKDVPGGHGFDQTIFFEVLLPAIIFA